MMIGELDCEEPVVEERAPELRRAKSSIATSCQWESSVAQPALAAAILFVEPDGEPTKSESPPSSPVKIPYFRRRLPFDKEFATVGDDWVAFKRRFQTNCILAGQTEALRALPTALDNDTLAAFCTILPTERATLPQAFAQMTAIYDPPSNVCHKITTQRMGEAKMSLAFRSVLLVLAKAAFPKMDHAGVDSLVCKRLLTLAKDLNIVLPTTEEDDLFFLKVARCIQAHLLLKQQTGLVACTVPP
ncbi:unnamed protein product [Lampetra fluviatilis]